MKLGRVADVRVHQALQDLAGQSIPLKAAYKLKNIIYKVKEEQAKYEEFRKSTLEKYGNRDEAGQLEVDERNNVKFSEENLKGFAEDLNSLMEIEFALEPIKLDDLGANVNITTRELDFLDGFIVE